MGKGPAIILPQPTPEQSMHHPRTTLQSRSVIPVSMSAHAVKPTRFESPINTAANLTTPLQPNRPQDLAILNPL